MGSNSKIEWTDHTFNPWRGCQRVSPGCVHCYAAAQSKRNPSLLGVWGPEAVEGKRVLAAESMWAQPLKWNEQAEKAGVRQKVFCASFADVFESWFGPIVNGAGDAWIKPYSQREWGHEHWDTADLESMKRDPQGWQLVTMSDVLNRLFKLTQATPWLDWLLVTKRPENILPMWNLSEPMIDLAGIEPGEVPRYRKKPLSNVWLGTSVENQEMAYKRIPQLLRCRELSPVLFLSCEPLLGPVDLTLIPPINRNAPCSTNVLSGVTYWPEGDTDTGASIDWVICGGESGKEKSIRPMHPNWARTLRDQCLAADVPFFYKQHGEWIGMPDYDCFTHGMNLDSHPHRMMFSNGKFADEIPREERYSYSQRIEELPVSVMRVGKKAAGRLLDGFEHNGMPEVRE